MHEHALETRANTSPFWFSLQLLVTKVGRAVAATLVAVKVAQKA
jgi:hypothetical protein